MPFPAIFIEELKTRNDIVDLISQYVQLRRAGSLLVGLCPFHGERSPSFTVYPSNSSFYCFGCGAGGDAITFMMKQDNCDYPEAVKLLAQRCGLPMPEDDPRRAAEEARLRRQRQRLLEMNREAAKFFHQTLFSEAGSAGMQYLQKRQLSNAIIKRFGLGYAPGGWDVLTEHMRGLGFTDDELRTGFLRGKSANTGKEFDYFRGRVIFPIIDVAGDVIAFGGRALGDEKPKYLNSSDTPVFRKTRNLFALNFAKSVRDGQFILCEGYMDVISLHQAGFPGAVASLGTALTADQVKLLNKYVKKVFLCYDSDEAGQAATQKAIKLFEPHGTQVRVLRLGDSKDPDEYIKAHGAAGFNRVLESAEGQVEYNIGKILADYDLGVTEQKTEAALRACDYIASLPTQVQRDIYSERLAQMCGLVPKSVYSQVQSSFERQMRSRKKKLSESKFAASTSIGDRINRDAARSAPAARIEEAILGILMLRPEMFAGAADKLSAADFVTDFNRRVYEFYAQSYEERGTFELGAANEDFSADEMGRLMRMQTSRRGLTDNGAEVLDDLISKLKGQGEKSASADLDLSEALKKRREREGFTVAGE